ncbi:type II toxin-antitoxin system VapC family toxin [Candidatus Shapirobacteria bacterium]|nr:type II toxin-antitoxin system VapC family toxin [Candidatus Shapirobacteria bacterium]
MIFVDTNYFLRFLLKDNQAQHRVAKELFLAGSSGKTQLFTSLIVIFEIYWVLSSFYQTKKERIILILEKILNLEFVGIENKEIIKEALEMYKKTSLELEDCYNLVLARALGIKEIKSFDKKLLRLF